MNINQIKIIIFVTVTCLLLPAENLFCCDLVAGYDISVPHHYKDKFKKVIGTDADILREAVERSKCKIVFKEYPWKRTLENVKMGKIHIAIGAKFTKERDQFSYYSVPYKIINHNLYTHKDKFKNIKSLEEFFKTNPKNKLGVVLNWGYPPSISKLINDKRYQEQVYPVSSPEQLIKMMIAKRLEGIIFIPESMEKLYKELYSETEITARATYNEELHFLFSRKSVDFDTFKRVNSAVKSMVKSGRTKKIIANYKK